MVSSVIYVSIHAIFCATAAAGWWWRKNRDTHTTHYRAKHSTYRLLATPAPATGGLCGLQNPTQVTRLIVYLSVRFARPLARASYHTTTDKELPCVCFGSYCCGGELVEAGTRLGWGTVRDGWET